MTKLIAWLSFLVAIFAGAGLAATEPGLVQIVVVVGALTALAVDIFKDRVPNRDAVVVAVALPSLIVSMNGGIPETLTRWLDALWGQFDGSAAEALGTSTMLVVAVAAVVVSLVLTRTMSGRGSRSAVRASGH